VCGNFFYRICEGWVLWIAIWPHSTLGHLKWQGVHTRVVISLPGLSNPALFVSHRCEFW